MSTPWLRPEIYSRIAMDNSRTTPGLPGWATDKSRSRYGWATETKTPGSTPDVLNSLKHPGSSPEWPGRHRMSQGWATEYPDEPRNRCGQLTERPGVPRITTPGRSGARSGEVGPGLKNYEFGIILLRKLILICFFKNLRFNVPPPPPPLENCVAQFLCIADQYYIF